MLCSYKNINKGVSRIIYVLGTAENDFIAVDNLGSYKYNYFIITNTTI